jgi:uncharacterized protein (TIGR03000 family)
MTRPLVALALLALPSVASAQVQRQLPPGPYQGVVWQLNSNQAFVGPQFSDGFSAVVLVETVSPRFTVGGGSMSPQRSWYPTGVWGNTVHVIVPAVELPGVPEPVAPRPVPTRRSDGDGLVRGPVAVAVAAPREARATLVVEFPAAAEVSVNGKPADGDPRAEWTLTSPALAAGASHTFVVKGSWKANGKTFEATRSVTVTAGERARSIVVAGTEVRE